MRRRCATPHNFSGPAGSKLVGAAFEARAQEFLQRQRLRFVARNVSCRGGEIDLVMRERDGALVFVEVRARAQRRYGGAAASIGWQKKQRIVRAAQHFLATACLALARSARVPFRRDCVRQRPARVVARCVSCRRSLTRCAENACECDKLALACRPRGNADNAGSSAFQRWFCAACTALPARFIGAARLRNTTSQHGRAVRSIRGRR